MTSRTLNSLNSAVEETKYLNEEIKRLESEKISKEKKRRGRIELYEMEKEQNKILKRKMTRIFEDEEIILKNQITDKEKKIDSLRINILDIIGEIKQINLKIENQQLKESFIFNKKKDKIFSKIKKKRKEINELKREIKRIETLNREKEENDYMLKEDLKSCQKESINYTSKIESLTEFIDNLSNHKIDNNIAETIKVSISEFKVVSKDKLSYLIYEKVNILKTNSDSTINQKAFFQNLSRIYMMAGSFNMEEIIERMIVEINLVCKFIDSSFDLTLLIKACIKLLFYNHSNNVKINFVSKWSGQLINNNIINPFSGMRENAFSDYLNKELRIIQDKITRKYIKIKHLKQKIAEINNEHLGLLQDENELKNVTNAMEQEIDSLKQIQFDIFQDASYLNKKLNDLREQYDLDIAIVRDKNKEIKRRIDMERVKLEDMASKYDPQIDHKKKILQETNFLYKTFRESTIEEEEGALSSQREKNNPLRKSKQSDEKGVSFYKSKDFKDYYLLKKKSDENINLQENKEDIGIIENLITRLEKMAVKKDNDNFNKPLSKKVNSNFKLNLKNINKETEMGPAMKKTRNTLVNSMSNFGSGSEEKLKGNNTNTIHVRTTSNFSSISRNEYLTSIIDKLKPLVEGCVVYKRNFVTKNKKVSYLIDSEFLPFDFITRKMNNPEDYSYRKYFLNVDRSINYLIFNKTRDDEKPIEFNLSSISRIVVPKITKDLVFIKGIYKKLKKANVYDINYYFETHSEKLSKLYCRESHVELDEKLFNDEYRQMLLDAGKYILYVYLKPDEETRLEIIFNEYNDFKHWINGLEEVLNNKQTKDIIKKKLI